MIKFLLIVALLSPPTNLSAACSGIRFTMRWTEPTTNADGTPLTDLAKTTLYYQVNTAAPKAKDYPAKLPTGGAAKTASLTPLTFAGTGILAASTQSTLSGVLRPTMRKMPLSTTRRQSSSPEWTPI